MRWQGGEEPDEQANKPVWMQNENGDAREAQTPTAVQFAPTHICEAIVIGSRVVCHGFQEPV